MDAQDLVEVYRAKNSVQAALFQQALQEAGITAMVENGLLAGGGIDVVGWQTDPRILVESKDLLAAQAVRQKFESLETTAADAPEVSGDTTACLSCGASMPTGVDKCPACGWSYDSQPAAREA